jgi:hypothetical protein
VTPLEEMGVLARAKLLPPLTPPSLTASYGSLNKEQMGVLRSFIKGRRLRDYGCGNLRLTITLVRLFGARHVEAIDQDLVSVPRQLRSQIAFTQSHFYRVGPSTRTAFVSWPINHDTYLDRCLVHAPRVIYLGTNMGGTACGYPHFWLSLVQREVLAYVPHAHNTLIVYGDKLKRRRRLMPEEYAALHRDDIVEFDKAHRRKSWPLPSRWRSCL